ncbi:DUF5683 domain-containing protein [Hymenobacter koreensis]|uniref:DUF5683 domain-containing protein n=1 Tax=Hymenobacter koreensis TaxID=1084523 RepID=A0ABP8IV28_9BACT
MSNVRFVSLALHRAAPLLVAVGLLLFPAGALQAQTVTAGPDSVQVAAAAAAKTDSLRRTERLFGFRMTRPAKSATLSLLLPGAGQIYNRKYWKLPLVYGALGATIYGELFYLDLYKEFRAGYLIRLDRQQAEKRIPVDQAAVASFIDRGERSGNPALYPQTPEGDRRQQTQFSRYRNRRDVFVAYVAVAYGMQVVDALVDGHLHDFDVGDNLSLRYSPQLMLPGMGAPPTLGMAFTLTLHSPAAPALRR